MIKISHETEFSKKPLKFLGSDLPLLAIANDRTKFKNG
jgi:hypothetical protein